MTTIPIWQTRRRTHSARSGPSGWCRSASHPSRLHPAGAEADRSEGQVGRLVLPLPRIAIRHRGADPGRSRTAQPRPAALHIRVRYALAHRLIRSCPIRQKIPFASCRVRT